MTVKVGKLSHDETNAQAGRWFLAGLGGAVMFGIGMTLMVAQPASYSLVFGLVLAAIGVVEISVCICQHGEWLDHSPSVQEDPFSGGYTQLPLGLIYLRAALFAG